MRSVRATVPLPTGVAAPGDEVGERRGFEVKGGVKGEEAGDGGLEMTA